MLGVFPEGAIEHPARHIMPFHPGVGLIISRTGAPVLPVVIEGTPQGRRGAATWTSLWKSSHSHVTFGPLLSFEGKARGGGGCSATAPVVRGRDRLALSSDAPRAGVQGTRGRRLRLVVVACLFAAGS